MRPKLSKVCALRPQKKSCQPGSYYRYYANILYFQRPLIMLFVLMSVCSSDKITDRPGRRIWCSGRQELEFLVIIKKPQRDKTFLVTDLRELLSLFVGKFCMKQSLIWNQSVLANLPINYQVPWDKCEGAHVWCQTEPGTSNSKQNLQMSNMFLINIHVFAF